VRWLPNRKWIEDRKDWLAGWQSIATILALIAGGVWTYTLTRQFRETAPKLAIKQEVSNWKLRDGSTLLRVDSTLTNTSKVRIEGVHGRMIIWRLLPETDEQAAANAGGKIFFACPTQEDKPAPDCVPEQGLNLPSSSKTTFDIKDLTSSLEPGESVPYWRYLRLDGDVKTVEVYTRIDKPGNPGDVWAFDSTFDLKKGLTGSDEPVQPAARGPHPTTRRPRSHRN
jgi:hypothetical protein